MRPSKYRLWNDTTKTYLYIDPEHQDGKIIEQFTGLKDINGVEIYEGDKLAYIEKMDEHGDRVRVKGEVFYSTKYAAFAIGKRTPIEEQVWNLFSDYGLSNIEVIGDGRVNEENI